MNQPNPLPMTEKEERILDRIARLERNRRWARERVLVLDEQIRAEVNALAAERRVIFLRKERVVDEACAYAKAKNSGAHPG